MLIACVSLSAGATEREGKMKRKREGEEEREEWRRRGKKKRERSRQPKEAIQEPNYSQKTILNDADTWKVHKLHLHWFQQESCSKTTASTYDSPWSWRTTKLMIYWIEQLMFVSTFSSFQETYQRAINIGNQHWQLLNMGNIEKKWTNGTNTKLTIDTNMSHRHMCSDFAPLIHGCGIEQDCCNPHLNH